jgi:hypothetical protein
MPARGRRVRRLIFVLLKADVVPGDIMSLQLAREAKFETGTGQCHCYLKTRNIDSFIEGGGQDELRADVAFGEASFIHPAGRIFQLGENQLHRV